MYYRLKPEIYLINGHSQSILSNVVTGEIIGLNQDEAEIIRNIENNNPQAESHTLNELAEIGWVDTAESPMFVDKIRYTNAFNKKRSWKSFPNMTAVTIQITNNCENECGSRYCRNSFCPMCLSSDIKIDMNYKELRKIIDIINVNNPTLYIITGGNPLAHKDFRKIYNYVRATGIQTFVNICCVDLLDKIDKDIPVILTISREDEFVKFLQKKVNYDNIDVYIKSTVDSGTTFKRYRDPPLVLKGDFEKRSSFGHIFTRMSFDTCLCGKITILCDGDVVPCLGMSKESMGNLLKDDGSIILKRMYDECWSKSVDDGMNGCTKCAYRYNCHSCKKYSSLNCEYNVEAGTWK